MIYRICKFACQEGENSLITVVELCSFHSVFNDSLVKYLNIAPSFKDKYEVKIIYLEDEYKKFIDENNIKPSNKITRQVSYVRFGKWVNKKFHFNKNKDIINIQFANPHVLYLIPFLKKNFLKIFLSFWGSDLFRQKKAVFSIMQPLFGMCNSITFETEEMVNYFKKNVSTKYNTKLRIVGHGSTVIENIKNISSEYVEVFRNKWGIPSDKKNIVIGYNGFRAQQHIRAIESIYRTQINPNDILIILPWTYGNEDVAYRAEVEASLSGKFQYLFIDKFLTDDEVSALRVVTDILIQIQTTDALSSSMLETLYAGNQVITGSWLPYESAINEGITLNLVDDPKDVGEKLKEILNANVNQEQIKRNKDIVYDILSWESGIKNWISLYID